MNIYKSLSVFISRISLAFLLLLFTAGLAQASTCKGVVSGVGVTLPQHTTGATHTIKLDMSSGYDVNESYYMKVKNTHGGADDEAQTGNFKIDKDGDYDWGNGQVGGKLTVRNKVVTWTLHNKEALISAPTGGDPDSHFVILYGHVAGSNRLCDLGTYLTRTGSEALCSLYVSQERNGDTCYSSGCLDRATELTKLEVEGLEDADGNPFNGTIEFVIAGATGNPNAEAKNGKASATFKAKAEKTYEIKVRSIEGKNFWFPGCTTTVNIQNFCEDCDTNRTDVSGNAIMRSFELCEQIIDADEQSKCSDCFTGGDGGVWTAIGCIPAKPESIIKTFITLGMSVGGGATLLLILTGAFRLSVSQGDPQATKDAKEQVTSAVIGLVFIILSITILRFIGVSLFQIPGFGT